MVRPIKSGKIVDRRDQVLMGLLSFFAVAASTFFNKWRSQNGPFLIERDIHYPCLFSLTFFIAALHNHRRCAFVAACTITFGRCPPRADRIASSRCFAFSAAMRMIHWIHCNAPPCRTDTAPAIRARLASLTYVMLIIAYVANGCPAFNMHAADLARTQTQLRIKPFTD